MGKIRSTKKILDFAPNFYSGVASVLKKKKKSSQLRKIIQSMRQDDGLYEDWRAVGNDLQVAMGKIKTEMTWQRK